MPTALITGASSGIGKSFAEQLAGAGHDLVLIARRADRLWELADRLTEAHGVTADVMAADLSDDHGTEQVERRILQGAPIDIVVNNAGFATRAPVAELAFSRFEEMLRVNILAMAQISCAALSRMTAEGHGAIINVASGTVFMQMPGNAGYGASKNFVVAFTRHMQIEAASSGVRVQLLIPGVVDTEFHAVAENDVSRFPPAMVMQADDLVRASLDGLARGEAVCIPSLPEMSDWEAYEEAERVGSSRVDLQACKLEYSIVSPK